LLDEAMDKLGSTDRNAILLRFFEEKPLREVGRNLGLSEDAARKRIDRSMEKLRAFFARRGFAVSAGGLSCALTSRGAEILPIGYGNTVASLAYAHSMTPASTLPALGRRALSAQKLAHAALLAGIAASALLGGLVALRLHTAMPLPLTAVDDQPEKASPAPSASTSSVSAIARAVTHPDFTKTTFDTAAETLRFEDLRSGNAVLVLKKGLMLTGTVTDQQQKSIAGATVNFGDFQFSPQTAITRQDGSFVLNHLSFGDSHLTITAEGYAPERIEGRRSQQLSPRFRDAFTWQPASHPSRR
jgi:hypothetical protein